MSFIINPFALGAGGGGGGSLPTDLVSGLELWTPVTGVGGLSNNDPISTYPDLSGNANDATQSGGSRPLYLTSGGPTGGPCIRMSTGVTQRYFDLPNFLAGSAGEVFIVAKADADPGDGVGGVNGPLLGNWGSDTQHGLYPYWVDSTIYDAYGTTARKGPTNNPDTSVATWICLNIRSAAGAWSWRINAATTGNDQYSTGTNTVGWGTAPKIGLDFNGSDNRVFAGLIVDIIHCSKILDDATERKPIIHDYINTNASYGGFFALPTS